MFTSVFSITQVSRELNVSENTTRRLIKSGQLRASRVGDQWRVFRPDLEVYLEARANVPSRRCPGEMGPSRAR